MSFDSRLKDIPALRWAYGAQPWEMRYPDPLADPWGGLDGFVYIGAWEGSAEVSAAQALYDYVYDEATKAKADGRPCNVIETGTCDSFSTVHLAQAIKDAGAVGKVYTGEISLNRSDGNPRPWPALWVQQGLGEYIVSCVGDTRKEETWMNAPDVVDVCFIDSEHAADCVLSEVAVLRKRLRSGGLLMFHDTIIYPEVARAVAKIEQDLGGEVEMSPRSCRGLAVLRLP